MKHQAQLPERRLPMEKGYNFRDLGGYLTSSGKQVRWRKLFRSDELNGLSENDLAYLSSIPVLTVVDFRSEGEIQNAPDKLPESTVLSLALPINPGSLNPGQMTELPGALAGEQLMEKIYFSLVTDSAIVTQYRKFFALLQQETAIPLLFHCTAGKDRTGIGSALILLALGVDEKTVFDDYLASNNYLENKYAGIKSKYPELAPFFEVKAEYLQHSLDTINENYGSIENYLTNELEVNLEKFRSMYLD